ncbi:hypothetical protein J6E39_03935 [bacterium]|nr:hypothetical protein [bacterium]
MSKRQIKPLPNGDCLLTFKSKSFNDNDYSSTLYYLPGLYAKDFGKLKLDYDKYPDERISRKKAFCKKHLIHCNNLPNHENISQDMGNFYELYSKKKYKNISQQDRNNDIADCKRMSDTLIKVTNDPKFIKEKSYNQYKMISQAIIDDNSNSLVFGEKEYYKTSDQTKKPEWVAEYRTNYSICKAYAYPNGKGFYLYRPVILDPNDKWRGWRGYQYEDYFTLDE